MTTQRPSRPFHHRAVTRAGIAAIASIVAAGCGGSGGEERSTSKSKAAAPDPTEVTRPEPDDDLIEALGAIGTTATTAGCAIGSFDEQEPEHVSEVSSKDWNSFPPTSGKHYDRWAPFGVYDETLDDGFTIHNLEHGGVAVWYGDGVDEPLVKAIDGNIDDGEKWLLIPRDGIDGIASSAWTKLLACDASALSKLGVNDTASLMDAWFDEVQSTGAPSEKDIPAYAGGMEDPKPTRDVSLEQPTFG